MKQLSLSFAILFLLPFLISAQEFNTKSYSKIHFFDTKKTFVPINTTTISDTNFNNSISQGAGTLTRGKSGFEISLGIYRWLKLEYSYGIAGSLDIGVWSDFQPILIGLSTIGIFSKFGRRTHKGGFSLRAGFGYAIGVLGDNIAGHGREGSGEGSQGFLYEFEAMNGNLVSKKLLFVQQFGLLITNQRNSERSKFGGAVNKFTSIPYLGLGAETIGKRANFFVIARITYVNRIKNENDFVFPDAKLGVFWHF